MPTIISRSRNTQYSSAYKCNGTIELNTRCRYCERDFVSDQQRISHEGSCSSKQAQLSDDNLIWKCPRCGWKLPNTGQPPKKRQDAQDRHTNQCRGTDLANRTCNKCQKVWDTMTARITHELACKTEEEQRTCRYCQQVFRTIRINVSTLRPDTVGTVTYEYPLGTEGWKLGQGNFSVVSPPHR